MNTFRLSTKKIYNDSRSSIENLHDEKIKTITKQHDNLDSKKKKLSILLEKKNLIINSRKQNINHKLTPINNEINNLEKQISDIENNTELIDYISNAWEFLINFENSSEKKETETEIEPEIEAKTEQETDKKNNILKFINKTGKNNKGEEYNKYFHKCFLNIDIINKRQNICNYCKLDNHEIDNKNGLVVCNNCGVCEPYFDNNYNNVNYSEIAQIETISQQFSYQRKNHFKEWLNQLQAKEVTLIPDSVIELILLEIKKERIIDSNEITSDKIKKYLKKLKLNKYYEHIPNIINRITNKQSLIITKEFENILLELFDKIQVPFEKHCPEKRKNFLSYSYTLHKFCQLLDKNEYLIYFPLLKSREKLFEQEKIWKEMCVELNWKFIPSI